MKRYILPALLILLSISSCSNPPPAPLWGQPAVGLSVGETEAGVFEYNCVNNIAVKFELIGQDEYGQDLWVFEGAEVDPPFLEIDEAWFSSSGDPKKIWRGNYLEIGPNGGRVLVIPEPTIIEWEKDGYINTLRWDVRRGPDGEKSFLFEHRGLDIKGAEEWEKMIRECVNPIP